MSDCGVCIGGEGEPIEDYNIGIVTANISRHCTECRRIISKGVEHEILTGRFEGEAINWRTCMDCKHISEGLSCESRIHGTLWTDLEGTGPGDQFAAFANFSEVCVSKVETVSAKQYLIDRWRVWKGLVPPTPPTTPVRRAGRNQNASNSSSKAPKEPAK
jgi:hypothetical protein